MVVWFFFQQGCVQLILAERGNLGWAESSFEDHAALNGTDQVFGCAQVLSAFQADHGANWFSGELGFATAMIWDELFFLVWNQTGPGHEVNDILHAPHGSERICPSFFFVLVCVFSLHFFFGGVGGGVLKERMIAAKMKCLETDSESLRFQGHLLLQAQSRRKHLEWWSDGREVLHLTWRIIPGLGYAVLGSAPFISHKVRPFGRGPQPQLIRGLTLAYNHHSS